MTMFAAITANSVQKRMGSLITSLCASSSFTQAGYVRDMVNFELSPLVPPKDRRHCALAPRNDGPIIPVVSTSPIVRRRLRSLPIAEFANRRVEHGPFPHTEFGFPENQARGRCHGVEAVLSAFVHAGWLDHGWSALAFKQKAPGHCMSPGALIRSAGYRGLRRSPKRTRAATPPHGI